MHNLLRTAFCTTESKSTVRQIVLYIAIVCLLRPSGVSSILGGLSAYFGREPNCKHQGGIHRADPAPRRQSHRDEATGEVFYWNTVEFGAQCKARLCLFRALCSFLAI